MGFAYKPLSSGDGLSSSPESPVVNRFVSESEIRLEDRFRRDSFGSASSLEELGLPPNSDPQLVESFWKKAQEDQIFIG